MAHNTATSNGELVQKLGAVAGVLLHRAQRLAVALTIELRRRIEQTGPLLEGARGHMYSALQKDEHEDATVTHLLDRTRNVTMSLWSKTTRRMRIVGGSILFLFLFVFLSGEVVHHADITIPKVSFDYSQNHSPYNASKVALLIENRPNPIIAPLMLHFMAVVPPDWRFQFMGSLESVEFINKSVAIREQVANGKLDLTYIPSNMTTGSQEEISRFLTTLWLYETVLQPAEWLLVFQTDSMLCANSQKNINDYLDYDWIGAPWSPEARFGGNGGLSIRRVSAMIEVLRDQQRADFSEPEDVWLAERLGHRPGSRLANGTVSLTFSGEMYSGKGAEVKAGDEIEDHSKDVNSTSFDLVKGIDDDRSGFYEPMGYHTGGGGDTLHGSIWGTPAMRKHIWDYCPEVKMTLHMDAAKYVPGNCNANWKRGIDSAGYFGPDPNLDIGYGTEEIDGVEYPMLPPGLRPW